MYSSVILEVAIDCTVTVCFLMILYIMYICSLEISLTVAQG